MPEKKKLIVSISDIHISDETLSSNVSPKVFDIFYQNVSSRILKENIKELTVILNGDIFEFLRSDKWFDIDYSKRMYNVEILKPNNLMLHSTQIPIQIWEDIKSKPLYKKMMETLVSLKGLVDEMDVIYVCGNHDKFMRKEFNYYFKIEIERMLKEQSIVFTLENSRTIIYLDNTKLIFEHGHASDEENIPVMDILTPAIGDVITIELLSGFLLRIKQHPNDSISKLYDDLVEINNISPLTDAVKFIEFQVNDGRYLSSAIYDEIFLLFKDSILAVTDSAIAKFYTKRKPNLVFFGDIVDHLNNIRTFMNFDSLRFIANIILDKLSKFYNSVDIDKLITENIIGHDIRRYTLPTIIVAGHTHDAKSLGITEGIQYYNTGTFLPVIKRDIGQESFTRFQQLSIFQALVDRDEVLINTDLWHATRKEF